MISFPSSLCSHCTQVRSTWKRMYNRIELSRAAKKGLGLGVRLAV